MLVRFITLITDGIIENAQDLIMNSVIFDLAMFISGAQYGLPLDHHAFQIFEVWMELPLFFMSLDQENSFK